MTLITPKFWHRCHMNRKRATYEKSDLSETHSEFTNSFVSSTYFKGLQVPHYMQNPTLILDRQIHILKELILLTSDQMAGQRVESGVVAPCVIFFLRMCVWLGNWLWADTSKAAT